LIVLRERTDQKALEAHADEALELAPIIGVRQAV
jgi:hypothetical protein